MTLQQQFEQAIEEVKRLPDEPSSPVKLELYALYKQATEGNIIMNPPSPLSFKEMAKYNAWSALINTPKEKAMQDYILLVEKLKA
jgi:diazepam-binding inhibitor (GABA receptor modulator, acyl-CoA-binding protein)